MVQSLEERTAPAAGTLDPTFGVGGRVTTRFLSPSSDYGRSTALDSLGRIVVAGYTNNGSNNDFAVARLTPAGALDPSFGETGVVTFAFGLSDDFAYALAVDSLNRVVVAGYTANGSNNDFAVARLTAAGTLDSTFDGDGKQTIAIGAASDKAYGVAVDSLDRVVVAGVANNGANDDFAVARLTTAGALDSSFDGDGKQVFAFATDDVAYGVTVDSLDRVLVAGYTGNSSNLDFAVARLTTSGALDGSFDGDGEQTFAFGTSNDRAYGVAVDSLNRVVIAGSTYTGASTVFAVARLTSAGLLDSGFDGDGKQTISFGFYSDVAYGVAVDSLDQVVAAGSTEDTFGQNHFAVSRFTSTGVIDSSFDGDGKKTVTFGSNEIAYGVAVEPIDRVLVAGYTYNVVESSIDFAVARLSSAGALDSSFDGDGKRTLGLTAQSNAFGRTVAVDSVGRTVVAGYTLNRVAVTRYTPGGVLDSTFGGSGIFSFDFNTFANNGTYAVAVDSLDRVVVAGSTPVSTNADFVVARLTAAGALDNSFDGDGMRTIRFTGANDVAECLAIDSLDRVIVGGYAYNEVETHSDFAVARLTTTGALDGNFDGDGLVTINFSSRDDAAMGVAVDSMDRIVIAGYRHYTVNYTDFAVARLTTTGALVNSFDGDGRQTIAFGAFDDTAYGVAIDSKDRVLVAGSTIGVSSFYDFAVARLTAAGALDAGFDGDGKQTLPFGADRDIAHGVAVDSLNRVVVAGETSNGSNVDFGVARFTDAGALDSNFDGDGKQTIAFSPSDEFAFGVAIASADRVIVAGYSDYNGRVFALARLTGDTTVASTQVNDGSVQRSRVTSLTIRFSDQVTFGGLPAGAFTLVRNGGGAVSFTANVSVEFGGTVVVLNSFTGPETDFGSLRDGRYTLTALASQISAGGQALDGDANGTPGGDYTFGEAQGLFRFFGDINGDRHVDIADFGLFTGTFNLSTGQTGFLAAFDFNGDGHVDIADFGQFSVRFFTPLP